MTPAGTRTVRLPRPCDVRAALGPSRRGGLDPTLRIARGGGEAWRATRTPEGPAALRIRPSTEGARVEAWGPGATWALDASPELLGAGDEPESFTPTHPLVRDLHRRHPSLRIGATLAVVEALVPTILEQKVVGLEARRSYAALVRHHGEPAPGPLRLLLPPSPKAWAATPTFTFHRCNVERKRADTVRRVGVVARRLDECSAMPLPDAYARLRAVPGVGAWSAAEVAMVALGDADAVSVGDYHLPNQVAWALAGEPRGDDARMLELLEPFRPHRGRVLRLLAMAGIGAPRYGPRLPLRNLAAH